MQIESTNIKTQSDQINQLQKIRSSQTSQNIPVCDSKNEIMSKQGILLENITTENIDLQGIPIEMFKNKSDKITKGNPKIIASDRNLVDINKK